jgi:hypothetical protein
MLRNLYRNTYGEKILSPRAAELMEVGAEHSKDDGSAAGAAPRRRATRFCQNPKPERCEMARFFYALCARPPNWGRDHQAGTPSPWRSRVLFRVMIGPLDFHWRLALEIIRFRVWMDQDGRSKIAFSVRGGVRLRPRTDRKTRNIDHLDGSRFLTVEKESMIDCVSMRK